MPAPLRSGQHGTRRSALISVEAGSRCRIAARRRDGLHHLLHVRLPLRHQSASQDGRIRYIEGNRGHPVNRGVLCAKGSAGIMQHYSPARLTKPLRRVGPRGSGEFREIEWDEALGTAAEWLGAIRAEDRADSPSSPAATSRRR